MNKKETKAKTSTLPQIALANPSPSGFHLPQIKTPSLEELNDFRSASAFMEALADAALAWKDNLPDGFEPAVLAILNGGIQIEVHALAQVSFHGIRIDGNYNSSPCSMLSHQSTVQILCYAIEVAPEEKRNPIGFLWHDNNIEV